MSQEGPRSAPFRGPTGYARLGESLLSKDDTSIQSLHNGSFDLLSEVGPYNQPQPHWCIRGCCTRKHWCCKGCCYRRCCSCCCTWIVFGLVFLGLLLTLFIGAAVQRARVASAGDTGWVYNTSEVCTYPHAGAERNFPNASEAHAAGQFVEHCGQCGKCSNEHDIAIYNTTAESLTNAATKCAFWSFVGKERVRSCLLNKVGFTSDCNDCWVDNVMCDRYSCQWICLLSILSGQRKNEPGPEGTLNPCLECDEKLCGPAFIKCAGANRRRSGISSDIGRLDDQVCTTVDYIPQTPSPTTSPDLVDIE